MHKHNIISTSVLSGSNRITGNHAFGQRIVHQQLFPPALQNDTHKQRNGKLYRTIAFTTAPPKTRRHISKQVGNDQKMYFFSASGVSSEMRLRELDDEKTRTTLVQSPSCRKITTTQYGLMINPHQHKA